MATRRLLLAGLLGAATAAAAAPPRPRSVVLVVVDALAAGHLGAYGYARATSPNIDALAARGALFERAYSASHWTLPALASLMSGLRPATHGALHPPKDAAWAAKLEQGTLALGPGERLEPGIPTLATRLAAGGRRNGAVVSGGFCRSTFGFGRGFTEYHDLGGRAAELDAHWSRFLEKQKGKPFFLYIHLGDAHEPYRAPEPFRSRWTDPAYRGPVDGSRESLQALAYALHAGTAAPADLAQAAALYDAGVAEADAAVGRVVAKLAALGRDADTAVVVTADHGEAFGEHRRLRHANSFHEEVLRVPLVLRLPGEASGLRLGGVARSVDLLPTLLDWLALPPARTDGRSLLPWLRGAAPEPREAFAEAADGFALVLGDEKLLSHRGRVSLYDLKADPGETRDLAASRPERVKALAARAAELGRPASLTPLHDELKAAGYAD